ncbi:hypothetical protein GOP47_0022679 [Adiantum capillus-veneris]|uniref:Peptidase A1 domain-containing protein n=1 Tax=Adiantum capillus-veneris TaxID=13818 RepID=A0A9D4Z5R3_ADICA|nr:hypothetical protein GOP47_0022679 [Adiantum capillus-veneris]
MRDFFSREGEDLGTQTPSMDTTTPPGPRPSRPRGVRLDQATAQGRTCRPRPPGPQPRPRHLHQIRGIIARHRRRVPPFSGLYTGSTHLGYPWIEDREIEVDGQIWMGSVMIYFTKISLGTPSKEYYVQVDTGSDLLWLNCSPCTACPRSNDLGMILVPYDPHTSSTSFTIACSDLICDHALKVSNSGCDSTQVCSYSFQYGDGSSTTGYLVADNLIYSTVQPNNSLANSEAKIVFGCGYSQSGNLLTAQNVVDGIIGFGQSKLSVISQLYSQGLTPGVFAHCLQGSEKGGGILVLGNVVNLGMVYTPIIASQPHYNVNLRGISVGGSPLIADSSAYETSDLQGTIFDSGTTLAYLMEPVYTSFINTIIKEAPIGARLMSEGTPCFIYTGSVDDAFPLVTLHFEGADMTLTAKHYLIQQADVNVQLWCIGWHPISAGTTVSGGLLTILGDIILKDQLVVYDLENQRIGWVNYDFREPFPDLLSKARGEKLAFVVLLRLTSYLPCSVRQTVIRHQLHLQEISMHSLQRKHSNGLFLVSNSITEYGVVVFIPICLHKNFF